MNWELANDVWKLVLPPAERVVLRALCEHADEETNEAFPSVTLLSKLSDISERQVQRVLAKLEAKQIISATGRTKGGRGKTAIYKIDLSKGTHKIIPEHILNHLQHKRQSDNGVNMSGIPAPESAALLANTVNMSPLSDGNSAILSPIEANKGDILSVKPSERVTSEPETVTFVQKKGDIRDDAYKEIELTCELTHESHGVDEQFDALINKFKPAANAELVGAQRLDAIESRLIKACGITHRGTTVEKQLIRATAAINETMPSFAAFDAFLKSRYKTQSLGYIDQNFMKWLADQKPKGPSLLNPPKPRTYCGKCLQGWVEVDPANRNSSMRPCACNPESKQKGVTRYASR